MGWESELLIGTGTGSLDVLASVPTESCITSLDPRWNISASRVWELEKDHRPLCCNETEFKPTTADKIRVLFPELVEPIPEQPISQHESLQRKTVYLAGPMSGLPAFGADIFDAAAADLRQRGYRVINPVELDRDFGFDPSTDSPEDFELKPAIRRDIDALVDCDAIVLLPGHERSKGATAELAVARWAGLEAFVYPSMLPLEKATETRSQVATIEDEDILDIAARITRGDRQASYGPPDQDFRRTADMWSAAFADMLQPGSMFETWHVAQAMCLLKISRLQHSRKRDSVVDLAGYARCMDVCYVSAGKYDS